MVLRKKIMFLLLLVLQKKNQKLYICDDNNLSVLTPIKDRRNWNIPNVANSFGIRSFEITDDPLTIFNTISKIKKDNIFPALKIRKHVGNTGMKVRGKINLQKILGIDIKYLKMNLLI